MVGLPFDVFLMFNNYYFQPTLEILTEVLNELLPTLCSRMIALMSPEDSWVAKWQRINRFTKGIYAISVAGKLPNGVIRDLKSRGIIYKPRDTSLR
jgi:hypothetical protein